MTSAPLLKLDKNLSIENAAKLMVEFSVRHVVVEDKEDNELIGMITTSDLALYIKRYVENDNKVPASLLKLCIANK